ncbi:SIS domain-containing protein [Kineococcus gynurae]|uniref:SIS domain-containing protein n=1 Tax=Kineococcus gynurae TaxID=452979 RepID=A0ABV5LVG1_9ACTN
MDRAEIIAAGCTQVRRQATAVAGLADQLDETFAVLVEQILTTRGKVVVTGSGTSGIVAERFAHLLSVCGTPAFALSAADALHGRSGAVTRDDLVIAFSKGGRSTELTDLTALLVGRGVHVVAVTEEPGSPFAAAAASVVTLRTEPADADLDGLVATGSTLVHAAWGDAVTAVLKHLRRFSADDVVRGHPAGVVGTARPRP